MGSLLNVQSIVKITPEANLAALTRNARKHLDALAKPKITGEASLHCLSDSIKAAIAFRDDTLDAFLARGREATAEAWQAILPAEDLKVRVSITWALAANLDDAIESAKRCRANYLAELQRRTDEEQRERDEKQRKINEQAAKDAAAAARKQGADKATQQEIKEQVLATPAPIVAPKVEKPADVSVRFNYNARITNLKSVFGAALNDVTLFALLNTERVRGAMESELRMLAQRQKDTFKIPGCELVKRPVDVQR